MDAAAIFLIVLVVFCVLQGMLIARVRGLAGEVAILKMALPGNQSAQSGIVSAGGSSGSSLSPDALAALAAAMGGVKDGE